MLAETCARQVVNGKSDISGVNEVADEYKIVFGAVDGLQARKLMGSWKLPDGLCSVQMLLSHITHFP